MTNSHDEMLENVALYALGTLPADQAAQVAAHLRTCAECQAEYELLRPAVTALGASAGDISDDVCPGPMLKARIMREVRKSSPGRSVNLAWQTYAAAACLALAIVSMGLDGALRARISNETVLIERYAAQIQSDNTRIATQEATIADLAGAKRYAFGAGTLLVHGPNLYVALPKLAAPPKGKVYQAWTLPKGSKRMAPSITFTPSGPNETVIRLPESASGVTAVAVSVEPEGGSQQPTSKPIAIAAL